MTILGFAWMTVKVPEFQKVAGTESQSGQLTPEVKKMIAIMHGEMARSEIMSKLGLSDEKHFREHYQQIGIKLGLIEMTIPDKPKSSKQKYRLTAKGKATINELVNPGNR